MVTIVKQSKALVLVKPIMLVTIVIFVLKDIIISQNVWVSVLLIIMILKKADNFM